MLHPSSARLGSARIQLELEGFQLSSWGNWISSYGKVSEKTSCINFRKLQNSKYFDLQTCDLKNLPMKWIYLKNCILFSIFVYF